MIRLVLARKDGNSVVGVRGLERPAPHIKENLGFRIHEVQEKGINKPLCWPWE